MDAATVGIGTEYCRVPLEGEKKNKLLEITLDFSGEMRDTTEQKRRELMESTIIRNAYLEKARMYHPDRNSNSVKAAESFVEVQKAYEHLSIHKGKGQQRNERHDIKVMIKSLAHSHVDDHAELRAAADVYDLDGDDLEKTEDESPLTFFKARLLATLLDYGSGGMPASSLKKKWNEIWGPTHTFPSNADMHSMLKCHGGSTNKNQYKKIKLLIFLQTVASDCCRVENGKECVEPLLFPINGAASRDNF